ncbi:MAG: hypothetical protein QOK49_1005 [Baekduia sp.]|jgi:hypothetical protein|nr:hypothetical protein [Baekduia sp.]
MSCQRARARARAAEPARRRQPRPAARPDRADSRSRRPSSRPARRRACIGIEQVGPIAERVALRNRPTPRRIPPPADHVARSGPPRATSHPSANGRRGRRPIPRPLSRHRAALHLERRWRPAIAVGPGTRTARREPVDDDPRTLVSIDEHRQDLACRLHCPQFLSWVADGSDEIDTHLWYFGGGSGTSSCLKRRTNQTQTPRPETRNPGRPHR